ncbi:uncharacterized protein LOC111710156 isoform X2 [Eurytemora carolleeae]|uniref:uncharacterized protein LOC111710156 isoform X2 n=1 Tax=Eurytemora carolleeae TaxID=1294199 RepID=UPI000C78E873|nr:uncharacterized protein LOC111710156 isoform X2 [Eurytemora carolleeae]|eukprot:XP_023339976.1 uncharacterized protein LOC111710156 isoform X2 [Eurytemora affinis]
MIYHPGDYLSFNDRIIYDSDDDNLYYYTIGPLGFPIETTTPPTTITTTTAPTNLVQKTSDLTQVAPTLLQAAPNLLQAAPNLLQAAPNLLQATPTLLQAAPNLIQTTPNLLQTAPNFLQTTPNFLQTVPNLLPSTPDLLPSLAPLLFLPLLLIPLWFLAGGLWALITGVAPYGLRHELEGLSFLFQADTLKLVKSGLSQGFTDLDKLLADLFNIRPEQQQQQQQQQQQYYQSNQQQFWNSGISSSQWTVENFGGLTQGNQGSLRPPLHGNQGNLRPLGQGSQVYQKPWSGAFANMNQENQKLELKKEFLKNLKSGISDHIFRGVLTLISLVAGPLQAATHAIGLIALSKNPRSPVLGEFTRWLDNRSTADNQAVQYIKMKAVTPHPFFVQQTPFPNFYSQFKS